MRQYFVVTHSDDEEWDARRVAHALEHHCRPGVTCSVVEHDPEAKLQAVEQRLDQAEQKRCVWLHTLDNIVFHESHNPIRAGALLLQLITRIRAETFKWRKK